MKLFVVAALLSTSLLATHQTADEEWYDFRTTQQYEDLTAGDRTALETVHRDFALLWGALDMYERDHRGRSPERLEALVPRYLRELPRDPFATATTRIGTELHGYKPTLDGWGYRYRQGIEDSFLIASVGLPRFPYLAQSGNVSLYVARGEWISGGQTATMKVPHDR